MRQVKRRSALPVYIAAAAFAIRALVLPLYTLWHFFTAALVTAAVWLAADRLIKPRVEYVPEPGPEPVSHGAEADAILAQAAAARREMERLGASIADPAVGEKIDALAKLSDSIARDAVDDPSDAPQIKKFQEYFLPSTTSLLSAYQRMSARGVQGENSDRAKRDILQMLDTELAAFQKQLDSLYQNDVMDVDAEIKVMQSLLAREGLTGGDGLREILRRTRQSVPGEGQKKEQQT